MKIATWNVNSLRARENEVFNFLDAEAPEILCMQETKMIDQEFPDHLFGDAEYDVEFIGQAAYNGVAIATVDEVEHVHKGLPGDPNDKEPRLIAVDASGLRIINIYLPNGQSLDSDKYQYKLRWMDRLQAFIEENYRPDEPVILCGDFNLAPSDQDVWNSDERGDGLFVSPPERSRFQKLLDWGFTDSVANLNGQPKQFTWWDYRAGGFQRNRGLRIDHLLITKPVLERAKGVEIHRRLRGMDNPSDHVPVVLELED